MAKKNEKAEQVNVDEQAKLEAEALAAQAEIDAQALIEQDKKNKAEIVATTPEVVSSLPDTEVPQFDEDGNIIASPEAVTTPTEPIVAKKSLLAKRLKEELDLELGEEDDDEKVFEIVKKVKSERDLTLLAVHGEQEFEKSDTAKMIAAFIEKAPEEKYRDFLVSQKISAGYSEDYALKFAEKEIEKSKQAVEDGEDDIVAIEANRLNNLAIRDYNSKKQEFAKAKAEASKLNISTPAKVADTIKNVKDILAVSDTILNINFVDKAKKQTYIDNATKFIEDGNFKKILEDPNELKEFLVWRSNRDAYEARLKNIGRQEEIYKKSSKPTIAVSGGGATHQPIPKKDTTKLNAATF